MIRALMAVLICGGAAMAQDAPPGLVGAVGLIRYGAAPVAGAAICSGVLVAPDLVLTAGHCVRGAQAAPGSVSFAAGYADGQSLALRHGVAVILPPGAVAKDEPKDLAQDVALLRLGRPVPAADVAALPLRDDAARDNRYTLIAYRRDAPAQAVRQDDCLLLALPPGLLGLSCPVVSGHSGAPVLVWDKTGWQVAAVMVAAAHSTPVRSLAARIPADLQAIITAAQPPP